MMDRIPARSSQMGTVPIRRILPGPRRQKVGPWVFMDHFGPATLRLSSQMDVRPHPHNALSTVTYLFAGHSRHQDSLGNDHIIHPGEVAWMRAGHGIVHSERMAPDTLGQISDFGGIQLWCAHPEGEEEQDPRFETWSDLPRLDINGVHVRLIAGNGWQAASPVDATSNLVYAIADLKDGQRLKLPDHQERAVYALKGNIALNGELSDADMLITPTGVQEIQAQGETQALIIGGDPIGPRHFWWNLIHSDRARLKEQVQRWHAGQFPPIPGDPFVPLSTPPDPL